MNQHPHTEFAQRLARHAGPAFDLPGMASWPTTRHCFDPEHLLALRAALAAGRPLLLRGEPGSGKSQLAHAAAFALGRAFLPVVVDGLAQAQDLLWRFDAVARLADAQLVAVAKNDAPANLAVRHYLQPGPLWWALAWEQAATRQADCRHLEPTLPDAPPGWSSADGCVVLIDEIDKADPEFPNGLLEVLANRAFSVPLLGQTVRLHEKQAAPLIIITSNEERELPAAFVRRCLTLTIALPKDPVELAAWLVVRGQWHFPDMAEPVLQECAQLLAENRQAGSEYRPGLAEYLDLLRTIAELGADALDQLPLLKSFYFEKQVTLDGA